MVLLWRDPKGETVTSVHTVTEAVQSSEMAKLQMTISQKDDLIAQLKDEISLLKWVTLIYYNTILIYEGFDTFFCFVLFCFVLLEKNRNNW